MVMTVWTIWTNQNLLVWENKIKTHAQIVLMASRFYEEWSKDNFKPQLESRQRQNSSGWAPPTRALKINVDTSIGSSTGYMGIGTIVCNCDGHFVVEKARRHVDFCSAKAMKAVIIQEVFSWIKSEVGLM